MKSFEIVFALILLATLQLRSSEQPHIIGEVAQETNLLEEVSQILTLDKHLKNPLPVRKGHKDYEIRLRQISVIKKAGKMKLTNAVSELIQYVDYVEDSTLLLLATPRMATGQQRSQHAREVWPAYDAILAIGADSVPQLAAYILDDKKDLDLRLTSFAILCDVDSACASDMGKRVLQKKKKEEEEEEEEEEEMKKLQDGIRRIMKGECKFWGVVHGR